MSRASETAAILMVEEFPARIAFLSELGHHHPGLRLQPLRRVSLQFGYFLADLVPAIDQFPFQLIDFLHARMVERHEIPLGIPRGESSFRVLEFAAER
jgi:hypothetical protein